MRATNPTQGEKPEGFIVRRSSQKSTERQSRALSESRKTTIDWLKFPGEIRKIKREPVEKVDQESFYNADVYARYENGERSRIKYQQQTESTMPTKIRVDSPESKNRSKLTRIEESAEDESKRMIIGNIHGDFQLNKYQQLCPILKKITEAISTNENQVLVNIRKYFNIVCRHNLDDISQFKFLPPKRELLKHTFQRQRLAIITVSFIIAANKYEQLKSLCTGLLKYTFENYLICLNLLTQGNSTIEKIFIAEGKEHLLEKGFQSLRTSNEQIGGFIHRIAKTDPLFANEFFKIIESYANHSVKSLLYAVLTFFSFYIHAIKANDKLPFLSVAPGPYLLQQPLEKYSLVIDFVQVFIDGSVPLKKQMKREHLTMRPYTSYFLSEMAKYYEIISFSDFMPIESNRIISKIDQKKVVKNRLYKYHVDHQRPGKDMEKIGRDLNGIILVDTLNDQRNKNLLLVNQWKGQSNDAQLAEICPLLAMISVKKLPALQTIRKIRQAVNLNSSLGLKYINCGLNL